MAKYFWKGMSRIDDEDVPKSVVSGGEERRDSGCERVMGSWGLDVSTVTATGVTLTPRLESARLGEERFGKEIHSGTNDLFPKNPPSNPSTITHNNP